MITAFRHTIRTVYSAQPAYFIALFVVLVAQGGLTPLSLYVGKLVLDAAASALSGPVEWQVLRFALIMQAAAIMAAAVLGGAQKYVLTNLGQLVRKRLIDETLANIQRTEYSRVENSTYQNRLQNAFQEASTRPLTTINDLFQIGRSVVSIASLVSIIALFEPILSIVVLALVLPEFVLQHITNIWQYRLLVARAERTRLQAHLTRLLSRAESLMSVRLYGAESFLTGIFDASFFTFLRETRRLSNRQLGVDLAAPMFSVIGVLIGLTALFRRAPGLGLTIGDFSLYLGAIVSLQGQFRQLFGGLASSAASLMHFSELVSFVHDEAAASDYPKETVGSIRHIQFQDVEYRYSGQTGGVTNISYTFEAGKSYAIVGRNGSGKSTLVKLLLGFYWADQGLVTVNGVNIRSLSMPSFHGLCSAVFQNPIQLPLSVGENVAMGRMRNVDRLNEVVDEWAIQEVVDGMSNSHKSILDRHYSGGTDVSGGQWQKIAIARMAYGAADLEVFDEPTTFLDVESRARVKAYIRRHTDSIRVVVTHDVSLAEVCDEVIVLERGEIVESGAPQRLMSRNGRFAQLYRFHITQSGSPGARHW